MDTTTNPDSTEHRPGSSDPRPGPAPLAHYLPGQPGAATPAVTLHHSRVDVLVLDRRDADTVVVCRNGETEAYNAAELAVPITDPALQADLVRRNLTVLRATRTDLREQNHQLRNDLAAAGAEHARTLTRIRRYAIDNGYRGGSVCLDGLNTFLETFGLDRYAPKTRVTFTVRGSYQVDGADEYAAGEDLRHHLRLDLTGIDYLVEDSEDFTVVLDSTELIDG